MFEGRASDAANKQKDRQRRTPLAHCLSREMRLAFTSALRARRHCNPNLSTNQFRTKKAPPSAG